MIVVSDTSPLNYLAIINKAVLLHQLFGQVIIPQAVAKELSAAAAPLSVRELMNAPPTWLLIRGASSIDVSLPRWERERRRRQASLRNYMQTCFCVMTRMREERQ